MPPTQEDARPMGKTVQSSRSHIRRSGTGGKRRPSGIGRGNSHPREKSVAEQDPPYRIGTTRYDHEEKIMIKVRILGTDGKEQSTTALVDSGASENFIDKAYAEASGIPMQQKATPRRVLTVDGSEVTGGPVTHDAQVHLTINHHEEDIRLHCIPIGNAPIILGLPWLKLHDPVIGWKNHTVKFHSDHCAEKCLQSPPRANTIPEEKATEQYYRKIPEEENWEIGKTDPWEVCQVVFDKIKETFGPSANPMILTDHKNLEYWKTKKDRPGKLASKPDILSRESGDSPWEGDMKHWQNHDQIRLPEDAFKAP